MHWLVRAHCAVSAPRVPHRPASLNLSAQGFSVTCLAVAERQRLSEVSCHHITIKNGPGLALGGSGLSHALLLGTDAVSGSTTVNGADRPTDCRTADKACAAPNSCTNWDREAER